MVLGCLLLGAIGWWHGTQMYELGRQQGRLDRRTEELREMATSQGRHLWRVK